MTYLSDEEGSKHPRDIEEIDEIAWDAIRSLLSTRIEDGSFGARYPDTCPDPGSAVVGTDMRAFWEAMHGEIRTLGEAPPWLRSVEMPRTIDILDIIVFCWRAVGEPIQGRYHDYFSHHHLTFDREGGQAEFQEDINRIFARNNLAYQLTEEGSIKRLAPPVLRDELRSAVFNSGDSALDQLLESARWKFLDRDPAVRLESLEKLWHAWERLKTLGSGKDKREQADDLLDRAAGPASPKFRTALGTEATALRYIGNSLHIRHSEVTQEPVSQSTHIDYLFHRLFALVMLVLRRKDGPIREMWRRPTPFALPLPRT